MEKVKSSFWMGVAIIWVSHLFMDFMLGVWPVYKTIAQVDLFVAGLIAGLGIFIGEGLQFLFGYLSDKGYQQKLLALGTGLMIAIPFLSYFESEWILFALVLCGFIGSGAFHPAGSSLVMTGPSHKSFLIALFACGGMIGAASSQITYAFLHHQFEGRVWFLALPLFLCAVSCLFFSFPKSEQSNKKINFRQTLQLLKPQKFKLILLYIIHILLQIVVMAFTFLLPDILILKGYPEWFCLGGGYFCFIMGSVMTSLPIGYCVDKVGYRLILAIIIVASTTFLYLFLSLETLSLILPILFLVCLGGTMGVIIPVVVAGGTKDVPSSTRGFVSALYMGGTTCLGGLGPILASVSTIYFGEQAPVFALQAGGLLLILSLCLVYYLPDPLPTLQQQPYAVKVSSSSNQEKYYE